MATGHEPNLLSPLADSLTLAAAVSTGIPTGLAVVGPGTDAELTEHEVLDRLAALEATMVGRVSPLDVERCAAVLGWHPTEASALVGAAALAARGAVDMRRGQAPTPLTERSCEVWFVGHPRLVMFPLANLLVPSLHLQAAADAIDHLSANEIAYERAKAEQLQSLPQGPPRSVRDVAEEAAQNGATHITTRRLLEQVGVSRSADRATLNDLESSARRVAGLWDLTSLSASH